MTTDSEENATTADAPPADDLPSDVDALKALLDEKRLRE